MTTAKIDLRPLVIQRFIDAALHFNKQIATSDIREVFGVATTKASLEIKAYRDARPDSALFYSGYDKTWRATGDWKITDEYWPGNETPVAFLKALKTVFGATINLAP